MSFFKIPKFSNGRGLGEESVSSSRLEVLRVAGVVRSFFKTLASAKKEKASVIAIKILQNIILDSFHKCVNNWPGKNLWITQTTTKKTQNFKPCVLA